MIRKLMLFAAMLLAVPAVASAHGRGHGHAVAAPFGYGGYYAAPRYVTPGFYYGSPYRIQGNAFYQQQFLGPPVYRQRIYGPGFYYSAPGFYARPGVSVGVGVF